MPSFLRILLPIALTLTRCMPFPLKINEFHDTKRRAIWNLLRVEWENIKQQKAQVEKDEQAGDDDEEKSAFLPPAAAALPMTVPAKRPNSGS